MRKYKKIVGIVGIFATLLSSSVIADESNSESLELANSTSGFAKIKVMANSMGGFKSILALEGVEFNVSGSRFEPEQSYKPAGEFIDVGDYNYKFSTILNTQQSRTEWLRDVRFPFIQQFSYTEVINGNFGAVFGFDTVFAAPQAPMLSTRLGAQVKQNIVSSPLALIHRAKQYSDQVQYLGTVKFNDRLQQVVSIPGWNQDIRIYIDVASKLPSKVETLEDDTVYGDAQWEIVFSHWDEVNGIKVPLELHHKLNGREINIETRSSVNLNASIDASLFLIPAELVSDFNADQFAWGVRSSQWFNRFLPFAIPFDLDQRSAATLQMVELAPKVFHAKAITHHSMIIEMDDYLIVTEAPLYEERSQVVISEIKKRWPNKPIKYLVVTHFHNDHIGGVRAYAALGATIIVGSETKDHYEAVFKAPHTVFPDALQNNPVDVKIKTVEAGHDLVLSDGIRNVRVFDVTNRHAIGTLVPFVEDENLLFVSDLYSPGFFADAIPPLFLGWSVDLLAALETSPLDIQWLVGGHGGISSYDTFVAKVQSSL
ncbi:hypothetical protein MNBD_GAMMA22-885 [hydrothermal vent metagenome]|uniref:Metallo-beta-lactamase domain-containing protein n=1 Tax=hydrothermal vent metagenome TaxID=652676 RepID=A0A3B1B6N8_9ZZZZ